MINDKYLGRYVEAKLIGCAEIRQGLVIQAFPLVLQGVDMLYRCEGEPAIVENPPAPHVEPTRRIPSGTIHALTMPRFTGDNHAEALRYAIGRAKDIEELNSCGFRLLELDGNYHWQAYAPAKYYEPKGTEMHEPVPA